MRPPARATVWPKAAAAVALLALAIGAEVTTEALQHLTGAPPPEQPPKDGEQ